MILSDYADDIELLTEFSKTVEIQENREQYLRCIDDVYQTIVDIDDDSSHTISMKREIIKHFWTQAYPTDFNDSVYSILPKMDQILMYESRVIKRKWNKSFQYSDLITLSPHSNTSYSRNIALYKGDITNLSVDFIVNAANEQLLGCFNPRHKCIDNIIHSAAGPRLRLDLYKIIQKISQKEKVGPMISSSGVSEEHKNDLSSCYVECLNSALEVSKLLDQHSVTIAFCCLSTGLYGFPSDIACPIAVDTVVNWLNSHASEIDNWKVLFNVFTEIDLNLYRNYLTSKFNLNSVPLNFPAKPFEHLKRYLAEADYLLIGAGAGLSAAAGLDYTSTTVFQKHFPAMFKRGFRNMYQFIGFKDWSPSLQWGYFLSHVNLARFNWPRSDTYDYLKRIFEEVSKRKGSDNVFIFTSNADGMFQQNGFPVSRILTAQGDYSRLQCLKPCSQESYWPIKPVIDAALPFVNPETQELERPDLIPKCIKCGGNVMMNVRGGDWFLETPHQQQWKAFEEFKTRMISEAKNEKKKVLLLEIGAGFNTPGVIRLRFENYASMCENILLLRSNKDHWEVPLNLENGVGLDDNVTDLLRQLHDAK